MSKPNFPCPICTAPTHIGGWNASSGTPSPNGGTWRKREGGYLARSRYCTGGEHHVFETREQAMPSANLTELKVHPRDAVHHDQDKLYDPKAFRLDLKRVLNGVLTTDQRRTLAQGTEQILVRALREGGVSRKKGPITPDAIVAATTDCLQQMADSPLHSASERREFRRAHILYVLARGVPTRDNSTSALTAESARMTKPSEVMAWIESAYGYRLKKDRRPPSPTGVGPRVDKWHPLRADAAPQPKTVIFLVRSGPLAPEHVQDVSAPSGERDAGLEMRYIARPYDHNRLEMSVRRALAGTDDFDRIARYVVQWCLWSLVGQDIVRSADLASTITHCLRRVNEIAYLSWCVRVKNLDVEDVWDEARNLITWAPPRLVFDPDIAADPRREHHQAMDYDNERDASAWRNLPPYSDDTALEEDEYGEPVEHLAPNASNSLQVLTAEGGSA